MRTTGLAAGLLTFTLALFSSVAFASASEPGVTYSPGITLQQPTTTPAETSPPVTPTPAPSTVTENDPSTFSTVTTYLSTAVLVGAIVWSFWWRRRKSQASGSTWRG